MKAAIAKLSHHVRRLQAAYVVLAIGLVPTALVYYRVRQNPESHALAPLALLAGLVLTFLLFGITWIQVNARGRAESMADDLKQSEAALTAEKERLAVTLQSIIEGVITTDTAGNVVSINKAGEQLTGWPQTEAVGRLLWELFYVVNDKTREPCPNPVRKVLDTGAATGLENPAVLIARDSTERIITSSAAPIRDTGGKIIGVVLVFRDVTERQKTEAELLRESKLESVGLLAGGIAHDFNNILQGIIGNVSLARMTAHSAEKMLERLAGVEKAAFRARDLTHQLLTFARGGAPIKRSVLLTDLVKDAAQFALRGSNVQCELSLAGDLWPVEVDEGQFRQVVNNLVINAMQAMPEGGRIEVRSENVELTAGFLPPLGAGKFVKISIRDYGAGIRPENLPRIFDPYFTTKQHGSGLGLASAYSIVRKHDGQIRVESTLGAGAAFNIYLPASPQAVAPPEETGQKQFFGHGRILVMDDEPDILQVLSDMLGVVGYEVATAREGGEAIETYLNAKNSGKPFAAVIMDLTIPNGMGGKEAVRRLKELDPQIKALVSSGYSYDPVMANFRQFGFSGIIPKPYVLDDLTRVLAEVLGDARPEAKAESKSTNLQIS